MNVLRWLRTASKVPPGQLVARARHESWLRGRRQLGWPAPEPGLTLKGLRLAPPPPDEVARLRAIAELWQRGRVEYLHEPGDNADWHAPLRSKLWRYERHYHGELVALAVTALVDPAGPWVAAARELIEGWAAECPPEQGDAWEPYPTARRILSWTEAAALEPALAAEAADRLGVQVGHLQRHLERHLRGNHLLCDAAALVAGGASLLGPGMPEALAEGSALLERELARQVLPDGGYAERTVQYHAIVLRDCLLALQLARERGQPPDILEPLSRMARWLSRTRRADGSWPWLNDAAPHVLPVARDALGRALKLGLLEPGPGEPEPLVELPDTGWTLVRDGQTELLFDCGSIGPKDNPGHGHADALTYELVWNRVPLVSDTGISTYDEGPVRDYERSSPAHACVTVGGEGTDETWKSFRVGRRGRVAALPGAPPDARVRLVRGRVQAGGFLHERAIALWPGRAALVFDRVTGVRKGLQILDHVPLDPLWSAAEVGGVLYLLAAGGQGLQLRVLRGALVDQVRGSQAPYAGFAAQGFGKVVPRTVARLAPDAAGICIYAFLPPALSARADDAACLVRAPGAELLLPLDRGLPATGRR